MKKKKQRNNHARRKGKRKELLLKNFFRRVLEKRHAKLAKAHKTKGRTIQGRAILHAVHISSLFKDARTLPYLTEGGDPSAYTKPKRSRIEKRARKKNSRASRKVA